MDFSFKKFMVKVSRRKNYFYKFQAEENLLILLFVGIGGCWSRKNGGKNYRTFLMNRDPGGTEGSS